MSIRFLTAGESHGKALVGIVEGMPAGLALCSADIDAELKRRQGGYGRGGRMKIESDSVDILSGVRWGKTLGSPIALLINNKDSGNWGTTMSAEAAHEGTAEPVTRPRPGHADLAGMMKYAHTDIRNVLERSSARETAMRVAVGAVAKKFLSFFGAKVGSYVVSIGDVAYDKGTSPDEESELAGIFEKAERSDVRCPDEAASVRMKEVIDAATKDGDSLGGTFALFITGLPPGLGSHVHWDRKLDGKLAQAVMSVQAIKGVQIGAGFGAANERGSAVMDEISYADGAFKRGSNNAGGIEGGMTNGMPVLLTAAMKPIPTLRRPLRSVDVSTKKPEDAAYERSDVCAVPAAAVVCEAMAAIVAAGAFLEKFGGDSVGETKRNYDAYLGHIKNI